jgi:uncharacterized SAM-binding protein YcdF (DUF218 family)
MKGQSRWPGPASRRGGAIVLRALGIAGLFLLAAGGFTPLANVLNVWMAGAARLEPAQAIVVLGRGGADPDAVLTNRSLRRTLHGVGLYHDGLAPLLAFSGGADEAAARRTVALGLGVPAGAVATVPPGHTTRGEAGAARELLAPRGIRQILLVADPIDMPRARALFEREGFTVLPAPTAAGGPSIPESRLNLLREIAIELLGWAYYRAAGHL